MVHASQMQGRPWAHVLHAVYVLPDYIISLAILCIAHLIAVEFRQQLRFGGFVGAQYDWYSYQPYLIGAIALAIAYFPRVVVAGVTAKPPYGHLYSPVVGLALCVLGITFLLPDQSQLETGYFVAVCLLLMTLIIPRSRTADRTGNLRDHLARLWANRSLLRIWVQFNIQSRYAQAILGILWIVLLPLSQALIMTVVFSQLLRVSAGDVPFIAFFLAGLVPWGLFNQAIYSGMRSILNAMGLITQINFPREIIVLSALGEALVDTLFMFVAMLVINAFVRVFPNAYFVWLPVLVLIQICMMTGLMFLASWLSVLIRDIPAACERSLAGGFLPVPDHLPREHRSRTIPIYFRAESNIDTDRSVSICHRLRSATERDGADLSCGAVLWSADLRLSALQGERRHVRGHGMR